jgi:Tfp pilus assembly protein PilN
VININLIAERRARKQREATILRMGTLGVLLIVFIMVALNVAWWKLGQDTAIRLKSTEDQLEIRREDRDKFRALKAEVEEKREIVKLLDQVRVSEQAWMIILADISRVIPNDVVLTTFTTETTDKMIQLRFAGRAKDKTTVGRFYNALPTATRWAKTPILGDMSQQEERDLGVTQEAFEITVPVKGLYGGEL